MQANFWNGTLVRGRLLAFGVVGLAISCASLRLAWRDPLPEGEPVRGPEGSYELVPPSGEWVRVPGNESHHNVDLSLARRSNDAWLNASVLRDRYWSADDALARGRSRTESLMSIDSRDEQDARVPSPEGELPGRLGVYCGTFDREIRARDTCMVILAALFGRTAYVVVGQVRVGGESDRQEELMELVRSLRIDPRSDPNSDPNSDPKEEETP
jgi:hypothetical protein